MKTSIKTLFCLLLISCTSEPTPIQYGKDNCDHCKMTIVDNKFGTELITKKGRTFRFDSDECMRDYIKENKPVSTQYYVTDYAHPGTLCNATTAFFLHSKKLKSPMGGNLAAYASKKDADIALQKLGGELLNWTQFLVSGD
jgi:copper chaperone NosL